jgi:hypothetical protein
MARSEISPTLTHLEQEVRELLQRSTKLDSLIRKAAAEIDEWLRRNHLTPEYLREAVGSLESAHGQAEFLRELAEQAARLARRCVVYVESGAGRYLPWHAVGFPDDGWTEGIPNGDEAFRECVRSKSVLEFRVGGSDRPGWMERLMGPEPTEAALIPLTFGERCPVVLYVDGPPGYDLASLTVVCEIGRLLLQNRRLLEMLGGKPPASAFADRWPTTARVEPAERTHELELDREGAVTETPVASAEEQVDEVFAAEKESTDEAPSILSKPVGFAKPGALRQAPQETAAPPTVPEEKPVVKSAKDAKETDEHEVEALRFARLLVAEIKLYNETAVEEGRRNGNLYARLRSDIDRSREMYRKRVHPSVLSRKDYFHEELVRILCQGDASLLGEEYPGPETISAEETLR